MRSDLKKRTTVNSTTRAPSAETFESVLDSASPHCPPDKSSCFKENININKSEAPKLTVEPLQMKRKKKGGGYNLRKSLAWDRAFFTEEGVLDPQELSVISTGASCLEGLPFINEDSPGGSQPSMKTVDLKNLKNSISKELPGEDDRKKDWSSRNLDSSTSRFTRSTSLASHKVPTYVGGKSGSRSGDCPRPSSSSSLKRPANVNVGKAAGKELKLPKVPGLKPAFSPICGTTKRNILGANCVKHNQIVQPDFNIQGNVGLKNSSKILKNSQIASKASSLLSVSDRDGNLGNSPFRRHSSANVSPVLVNKVDSLGSKRISDYKITPARPVNSSEGLNEPTTSAAPLAQDAYLSGRTMHHLQNQPMKPSGLRMPSPSLSFFSQPKRSVLPDLPLRDRKSDVCGSQKPGNLRLQDNLRTTTKIDYKIPVNTISRSKSLSSRSDCMASHHCSGVGITKSNLESSSMQKVGMKVQEHSKKIISKSILSEEAELLEIDIEVPSLGETREQVMDDNFLRKVTGNSPVKSASCRSGCRFPELRLEKNYDIHEFEKDNELDDRMHSSLTTQSDWQETCKPDCHEPHTEKGEPFKYSPGGTHKRTSIEALGCSRTQTKDSYIGEKHLHADLLNEAAVIDTLTGNLLVGESHKQNAVSGGSNENKESRNGLEVEKESCRNAMLTTSDRMLLEKQTCLQNSLLENNVENLLFVVPIKKDGNELIKPMSTNLLSPGKLHDCSSDKDIMIEPLTSTESDSVDNLVSSESYDSLKNSFNCDGKNKGNANSDASFNETTMPVVAVAGGWQNDYNLRSDRSKNVMLNCSTSKSLSNSLHQDTHRTQIDYCSSFPGSRIHEVVSPNSIVEKVTDMGPIVRDDSASNWLYTLEMSSKESESDMDNLRNIQESGTLMVQSPESTKLKACCFKQPECYTLPNAEFVAENIGLSNGGLQFENHLQTKSLTHESNEDNVLGRMGNSVTGQETYIGSLKEPSIPAKESLLKHECSNVAYGSDGHSPIADAITYSSRVEPFSDTSNTEVSELSTSSFSCLHPGLEHVKVESESAPSKHEDGLDEKSRSFVLPQNAVPFSDEWLAAIEAAGEDILTKKSGAVQNSPPDKAVPEPSPWSPVKRKNNHIGPFDCTKKFTNVHPSDSN